MKTSDPQKTLYLVDGSYYIFRAFYGSQPLSTKEGFPTNAIHGFTRMLNKLINEKKPKYLAVVFDTAAPNFRHQLYAPYKANRKECPEDLSPQMPYFSEIVESLGIKSLSRNGFEADDIIASLTQNFKAELEDIVIVSADKDLAQLVEKGVTMWDPKKDFIYNPKSIEEKFGVGPSNIVDFLALAGDSSDNIPGVSGVGPKSAVALIKEFGSVDNLINNSQKVLEIEGLRAKKKIYENIKEGTENLKISKELVTLRYDVELQPCVNSLSCLEKGEVLEDRFLELCDKFELEGLKKSLLNASTKEKSTDFTQKKYHLVINKDLDEFIDLLKSHPVFAIDTETTSLDSLNCDLVGISISFKDNEAYYLPISHKSEDGELLDVNLDKERLFKLLNPILSDTNYKKVGLNIKYDIKALRSNGYDFAGTYFDSMIASHLLNPDKRGNSLAALSLKYFDEPMLPYTSLTKGYQDISYVPLDQSMQYACHDADITYKLLDVLAKELSLTPSQCGSSNLLEYFLKIEMPLVEVLAQMEIDGVLVDNIFLQQLQEKVEGELEALESQVKFMAGVDFNLNSSQQLSKVLFEDMGLSSAGLKKTKSKSAGGERIISTDSSNLQKLAQKHEIGNLLLDYRELQKLNSTYIVSLQRLIDKKTKRVHTHYNQAITATGRLSSSDPNLQNIPIKTERGRSVRKSFIADTGCKMISADYSQVELRLLAHFSQDKNMIKAFAEGVDIHSETAKTMFGLVDSKTRRIGKTINFGIVYGISSFNLAKDLGVTRGEAAQFIENYFAKYPNVKTYYEELEKKLEVSGKLETLMGRLRIMEDINTGGRDGRYAYRSMLNFPMQGSAAEIIKVAMVNIQSYIENLSYRAKMLMQVHDELVFEVDEDKVDQFSNDIKQIMESAGGDLLVPLKIDLEIGESWYKNG